MQSFTHKELVGLVSTCNNNNNIYLHTLNIEHIVGIIWWMVLNALGPDHFDIWF